MGLNVFNHDVLQTFFSKLCFNAAGQENKTCQLKKCKNCNTTPASDNPERFLEIDDVECTRPTHQLKHQPLQKSPLSKIRQADQSGTDQHRSYLLPSILKLLASYQHTCCWRIQSEYENNSQRLYAAIHAFFHYMKTNCGIFRLLAISPPLHVFQKRMNCAYLIKLGLPQ